MKSNKTNPGHADNPAQSPIPGISREVYEQMRPYFSAPTNSSECPTLSELTDFADGTLKGAERTNMQAHASECPACCATAAHLYRSFAPVRNLHCQWFGYKGVLLDCFGLLQRNERDYNAWRKHVERNEDLQMREKMIRRPALIFASVGTSLATAVGLFLLVVRLISSAFVSQPLMVKKDPAIPQIKPAPQQPQPPATIANNDHSKPVNAEQTRESILIARNDPSPDMSGELQWKSGTVSLGGNPEYVRGAGSERDPSTGDTGDPTKPFVQIFPCRTYVDSTRPKFQWTPYIEDGKQATSYTIRIWDQHKSENEPIFEKKGIKTTYYTVSDSLVRDRTLCWRVHAYIDNEWKSVSPLNPGQETRFRILTLSAAAELKAEMARRKQLNLKGNKALSLEYTRRARFEARMGRPDEVKRWLDKALETDPHNHDAQYLLKSYNNNRNQKTRTKE